MLTEVPSFYSSVYNQNALRGYRILTLACRKMEAGLKSTDSRDQIERNLTFVGFILFSSDLKADSKSVIKELRDSENRLVMITGDGLLTSLDVARRVGIIDKKKDTLALTEILDGSEMTSKYVWRVANLDHSKKESLKGDILFEDSDIQKLSLDYYLSITGAVLEKFLDSNYFSSLCKSVLVFSRMTPSQKTSVIVSLRNQNMHVLMCGDGTNDVGALRSAHVGISVVNDADLEKKLSKLKSSTKEQGKVYKSGNSNTDRLMRAMAEAQLQEADPTLVRLGDASLASAFTSRRTSIDSVLTVVRQGRCTLVTTIQVYKILALNCLVSAYGKQMYTSSFFISLTFLFDS